MDWRGREGDGGSCQEAESRRNIFTKWTHTLVLNLSYFKIFLCIFWSRGWSQGIHTLCGVWGKCCFGRTHRHHRTHLHWRNRRSLAQSVKGWGCEPGRQRRCWGLKGHSLTGDRGRCQCYVAAFVFIWRMKVIVVLLLSVYMVRSLG